MIATGTTLALITPTKTFYSVRISGELVGFVKDPFEEKATWWVNSNAQHNIVSSDSFDRIHIVSDRFLVAAKEVFRMINSPEELTIDAKLLEITKGDPDLIVDWTFDVLMLSFKS